MSTRIPARNVTGDQIYRGTPVSNGTDNEDIQHILIADAAGNIVNTLAAAPAGTERGIVTRPIASGVQTISEVSYPTYAAMARSVSMAPAAGTARYPIVVFHPSASALRAVLRGARLSLQSTSAATIITASLVRVSTAGSGGTAFTPGRADSGDPAAACTVQINPTTLPTEVASDELATHTFNAGTAAGTTVASNFMPYTSSLFDDISNGKNPAMRSGIAEGWAIKVFSTAAVTIVMTASINWTEA